jgi:cytochrome c553
MTLTALAAAALGTAGLAQDWGLGPTHGPSATELERALAGQRDEIGGVWKGAVGWQGDEAMLEKGRLVAMGGAEQGGAMMACVTCHGADGRGDGSGAFPRMTGQPAWYLYKQLKDYASGARPNRVMSGIADRLTEEEMRAVAAYYAVLEAERRPVTGAANGLTLQWGGQLAAVGSAEKGIPACVNCHGASGAGLPPSVPYLAGQYAGYMTLQLKLWKAGIRDNDAMDVMETIATKMTEEDMRAVSQYYARVRPASDAAPGPRGEDLRGEALGGDDTPAAPRTGQALLPAPEG